MCDQWWACGNLWCVLGPSYSYRDVNFNHLLPRCTWDKAASCLFLFISCRYLPYFGLCQRGQFHMWQYNCKLYSATHADIPVVATVAGEEGGMSEQSSCFLRWNPVELVLVPAAFYKGEWKERGTWFKKCCQSISKARVSQQYHKKVALLILLNSLGLIEDCNLLSSSSNSLLLLKLFTNTKCLPPGESAVWQSL